MKTWDIPALLAFHASVFGDARMEDPPAGDPPAGDPPAGDPPAGDKTFTQADLDRIVADRLARAKPKDYDDLKAAKAELDKIRESQQSDTEKAVNAAKKETEDAVRAEVRRERVLDRVEVLAAKDFADAEDARLRLEKRADDFVTKDGTVDADAIKAALAELLKGKPHLSANGRPKGDADQGARDNPPKDVGTGRSRLAVAYARKT
jgi:hypothetical protein